MCMQHMLILRVDVFVVKEILKRWESNQKRETLMSADCCESFSAAII